MALWRLRRADEPLAVRISEELALPFPVARALAARGHGSVEAVRGFLEAREAVSPLAEVPVAAGLQRAVERLRRAAASGEPIVVYGDYDCDGVTSTTILYRYLRSGMGAQVQAFVPHRMRDGYGVNAQAVRRLADQGAKVILTCDNGISAHEAAIAARACGVDLIVTDHHTVPAELPAAYAIVHPALEFPHLRDLAGVGVAFVLVMALAGGRSPRLDHFLELMALGTVADMVPLDGINRALVWEGLKRLRSRGTSGFAGLQALIERSGLAGAAMSAGDIGFKLGPRLNAAGRIDDPSVGLRLLCAQPGDPVGAWAEELEALNRERRERHVELEAAILERIGRDWDLEAEPFVVLADPSFHHGLTGIVAGRVKERFRVPVLLLSGGGDGLYKGSGRSPEGLNLYEALQSVREHLVGFGGHAGAAGCSVRADRLGPLRHGLNRYLQDIGWRRPADEVVLDALLPFDACTPALLEGLDRLEPCGQRNLAPVFGLMYARVLRRETGRGPLRLQIDDGQSVAWLTTWEDPANVPGEGWVHLRYELARRGDALARYLRRVEAAPPPPPIEGPGRVEAELRDLRAQRDATAEGIRVGREQQKSPPPPGASLVVVGPPPDERTWGAWRSRAEHVTLLRGSRLDEKPLESPELQDLYQGLWRHAGLSLERALDAVSGDAYRKAEGLAILREAGLCVVRSERWFLLAAPAGPIGLDGLVSYQDHLAALAFRRAWSSREA